MFKIRHDKCLSCQQKLKMKEEALDNCMTAITDSFLFMSQLLRKIRPKKHDKVTCLFPHNYAIKLGQGCSSSDISKTIIPSR